MVLQPHPQVKIPISSTVRVAVPMPQPRTELSRKTSLVFKWQRYHQFHEPPHIFAGASEVNGQCLQVFSRICCWGLGLGWFADVIAFPCFWWTDMFLCASECGLFPAQDTSVLRDARIHTGESLFPTHLRIIRYYYYFWTKAMFWTCSLHDCNAQVRFSVTQRITGPFSFSSESNTGALKFSCLCKNPIFAVRVKFLFFFPPAWQQRCCVVLLQCTLTISERSNDTSQLWAPSRT